MSILQTMKRTHALAAGLALFSGFLVGWFDVGAGDVRGPLLLFMIAAFAAALISRAPAWLMAVSVAAGLPLAHLVASAFGQAGGDLQPEMLVILVPLAIAAYA